MTDIRTLTRCGLWNDHIDPSASGQRKLSSDYLFWSIRSWNLICNWNFFNFWPFWPFLSNLIQLNQFPASSLIYLFLLTARGECNCMSLSLIYVFLLKIKWTQRRARFAGSSSLIFPYFLKNGNKLGIWLPLAVTTHFLKILLKIEKFEVSTMPRELPGCLMLPRIQ